MSRRLTILLLASLVLAVPALARVLSYAPYTNRVGTSGYHDRTSRSFVLIEADGPQSYPPRNELVLYDTGAGEPRVVYSSTPQAWIVAAALYEYPSMSPLPAAPFLLVILSNQKTVFSRDGGQQWSEVAALGSKAVMMTAELSDFGGPWTGGLGNTTRLGTAAWPFVVSLYANGVWAIDSAGSAKQLMPAPAMAFGQNAAGNEFLVRSDNTLHVVNLDGTSRSLSNVEALPLPYPGGLSGWITSDSTVYIQATSYEGRALWMHRNGELTFVAGADGFGSTYSPPVYRDPMEFFAVPSHDFNGAWMINRGPGRPTRLSRHTPGAWPEVMWSDVSGPQVEAIIAGRSGEALLIQVHRDRSAQLQRPFIDPALAVWQVGSPMPREYDELYLNEEANKGFVHVDVDAMAAGDPFVFNSGSFEMGGGGPVSPPTSGGGEVMQEWGVVRGSLKQRLVLPGVARLNGAFGSRWLTDVTIYNPADDEQDVDVSFVGLGEEVQASEMRTITLKLAPHEIRFIPDALQALFAIEDGGGALHFLPAAGMNVVGRTYSRSDKGTYGFGMQAIDYYNAAGPRFPMTFAGAFPGEHFRTNILLTDASGRGSEASLNAFGLMGQISTNTSTITAPANGILQLNGLGGSLGVFDRDRGGLVVQPTRGMAIATVVAIDNRTNDPTYFPPDLPSGSLVRTIPVIGHVNGANNSRFRSDVYLFNPSREARTVVLEAKLWDSPAAKITQFTLLPLEARAIPDALSTLFQMEGLARLRYWSNDLRDGVRVTSRTYTVDDGGATYGSLIPPLNSFQTATAGDALEIIGVTAGPGFRTNLGLVELSPANSFGTTTVRVRIIDEQRRQLDSFSVVLLRSAGTPINDIFASRGLTLPEAAMIIVEVETEGIVGAYATLTDNRTNDTTYLGANLAAKPN